jgi:hypothetical protein
MSSLRYLKLLPETKGLEASLFKGKSFWGESKLPPKTYILSPVSCLLMTFHFSLEKLW